MTAKLLLVKSENGLETRQDYDGLSANNPTFTGVLTGASAALTGGVDAGGEIKSGALVGTGARPVVALADGTIDDQDAATFRTTIGALAAALKGAANGVAELGADGRVPSGQLPSYVDDVLEYANFAAFPVTGETGKIYINLDQNKTWRWSGSAYVEISASLALGETSATAYRGDRGKIAYDHSQLTTGNPHGTTAADVGALAEIALTGTVDANSINSGKSGVYRIAATTYTNFWAGITSGQQVTLLQMQSPAGMVTQFATDHQLGGWVTRFQVAAIGGAWSPWFFVWDSGSLPVSTFAKTLLDDTTAAAARATLGAAPLAGAEILIHSDFGRSATTDVWQSAFTNNAASGLQFAANSIASGTKIVLESLCYIPADSGSIVELCIGPQLTGDAAPTGSTYAIVLTPGTGAGEGYGNGILRIEIELIGSGSAITGYVVASFQGSGQAAPVVATGVVEVDGTLARTLDLRFNPFGTTAYTFRRNRVFRRNP